MPINVLEKNLEYLTRHFTFIDTTENVMTLNRSIFVIYVKVSTCKQD